MAFCTLVGALAQKPKFLRRLLSCVKIAIAREQKQTMEQREESKLALAIPSRDRVRGTQIVCILPSMSNFGEANLRVSERRASLL